MPKLSFIREYQKSSQELLPTRGVIHDMGGAVTHKEIIVTEYLSGKESPQISLTFRGLGRDNILPM